MSDTELDRLARQAAGDPKSWPTVRTLDTAFDAPPSEADAADVRREVTTGALGLIARAALRLLLHI